MQTRIQPLQLKQSQKGFTLIELIMVIILLAIVGMLGGNFIAESFKGFSQSDSRMEIYEEGKIALFRMEREIHHAIPNAINVTAGPPSELQFGMINEVAMRGIFGRYNENPPTNQLTDLLVLPPTSDATAFLPIGSLISIYNRNWNDFTAAPIRLYQVTNEAGGTMTISANVPPPRSSPSKRYYAVQRAIRYRLNGNSLSRSVAQVTTGGVGAYATEYPLATGITPATFTYSYTPASLTRNAIVAINFTISKGGESVDFHKEVHIKNVP